MELQAILEHKELKSKTKVKAINKILLDHNLSIAVLIKVASISKDKEKGICIEAIESATRTKPDIANAACLNFVTKTLEDEAPKIKWESARVVGNIAHLYPDKLNDAIGKLLTNTEHSGTVVRWSAAFAIGEIAKLNTKRNKDLIPAIEAIIKREEDNAIRKIYQTALKKANA